MSSSATPDRLRRELGVFGATLLGLGSIVGTGVFVSIGIAAGITGASVVLAVGLAAFVAAFNGSSSAQLAAAHPVSGGTYEYGYEFLNPALGFVSGWTFLTAKSASAATAALGFSGYTLNLFDQGDDWLVPLALVAVVAIVLIVLTGIRFSSQVNAVIVTVTLVTLAAFVFFALGDFDSASFTPFLGGQEGNAFGFLEATALMFVAYTGYGRIATLGEEVHHPRRTIPLAIGSTLLVTAVLYVAVALAGVGAVGADGFASLTESTSAPLEAIARVLEMPGVATLIAIGAVTAMLGVLLNLILGLSRVLLAMGRRGDMPAATARLDPSGRTPVVAAIVMGVVVGALALTGDVRTTWSFSAFNVLIYYALTNAAALRLPAEKRFLPRWLAWAGLASCSFLVFFVDAEVWLVGGLLLLAGLIWFQAARARSNA
ncbi:MAG: APC family permease [Acidimicrobiia bacterium]|nr:APC family permease [Acidimicrobiia bacterium]